MFIFSKDESVFPDITEFPTDGLIAAGGNLNPSFILQAYYKGAFPWYNANDPILWWYPNPRCVLFPEKLKISKSMQQVLRQQKFRFTANNDFSRVIQNCRNIFREGQDGTWILPEVIDAYTALHEMGHVHSAEAWENNELVGGLYGVKLGKTFFGESMFSKKSNASKFAFIQYVKLLQNEGIQLIDCQIKSNHLLSLGAEMIPAERFSQMLKRFRD